MDGFTKFMIDRKTKDLFLEQGLIKAGVHPILAGSWQRSSQYQVDPNLDAAPVAPEHHKSEWDDLLLKVGLPLFRCFSGLLDMDESTLILSNGQGVILHMETGRPAARARRLANKHNLLVDADWREEAVGTNAIGTAIAAKTNVFVAGHEHYSYAWHPYACAASPIYDLKTGEVIGVVNVSSFYDRLHLHSLGWVTGLAKLIGREVDNCRFGKGKEATKKGFLSRPVPEPVGESPAFLAALADAGKAAKSPLNVLILGETGTGKEVLAKFIHDCSERRSGPFVAVNCSAIPKELVASELVGYGEGAFTGAARRGKAGRFEQANGGTLFLDEIGDAPYEVQLSLLRVLEEKTLYRLGEEQSRKVDVRVICATGRNLAELVGQDLFRKDLYYRLSGITLTLPPLRLRGRDILLLAEHFLQGYNRLTGRHYMLSEGLKELMLQYTWPGNVRELKNAVERMAALADGPLLSEELFTRYVEQQVKAGAGDPERDELLAALARARGNISLAAELLGVNRTTVYRRMKKYGLCRQELPSM